MKNFLSVKRASSLQNTNITKQAKATYPEGCVYIPTAQGECQILPFSGTTVGNERFSRGDCFCVDSSSAASFIFGQGLSIEGIGYDGTTLAKRQNAWGGSTGYFKITAEQDTEVNYIVNAIYIDPESEFDSRSIAVLKDWDGKIKYEMDVKTFQDVTLTEEKIFTGANQVTVSYETDDDSPFKLSIENYVLNTQTNQYEKHEDRPVTSGDFTAQYGFVEFVISSLMEENKKYDQEASVTVKIDKKLPFQPEKIFQVKPNQIFDDSLEEYEFLSSGGLSAGAIAGIVIACVVVVGVIVFCVIWFVVLKKGCCCGGGKNSDAEA